MTEAHGTDTMAINTEKKQELIEKFGKHEDDHGSAAVQVAILTHRIDELTAHFDEHPQDHDGRRGLIQMVGRRRRLLDYLRDEDVEEYRQVVDELDLRR